MRGFILLVTFAFATPAVASEPPDFNRDVRPILSARCFKCHGPDEASRKAKLRLDTPDGAKHVLGKPEKSEFLLRIFSDDDSEIMPPPSVKSPLTPQEKLVLKNWIAAGGTYAPHWAFVPVKRPAIPRTAIPARNAIDHFVLEKLQKEGWTLSKEADRTTLIRRVYLDLIGIPPTPEDVDAFVKDASPEAYEKLVDRLLATPQYGERWARRWLDLARYADTNGYEKDRPRSIWPYRDWVIRAINADMPFDRFTIEQLAGDLLSDAGPSQRIATGFHRNTMLNEEGGIDPLEFRFHAMVDRVATTGTAFLGLTLGCAQCHTHKFDPITHTDYFRFFAFLNNSDEPEIAVPSPEQARTQAKLHAKIRAAELSLAENLPAAVRQKAFAEWLATERKAAVEWVVLRPTEREAGPHTKLTALGDGSLLAHGDAMKRDVYTLTLTKLPPGTTALRIEALPHESLPANGPGRTFYEGRKGDFLLSEVKLSVNGQQAKFASATESYSKSGLGGGAATAMLAIDGNALTGWAASGREGQASNAVFVLEQPLTATSAKLELVMERHYAASLGRFRISATTAQNGAKARDLPAAIEELLLPPDNELTAEQRGELLQHWATVAPELKAARAAIEALRKQLPTPPTTLVMHERPADHPRITFRHHRGEFLQPREQITAGVPAWLPSLPKGEAANRLAFARWIASPSNPLTARVAVNRQWQAFFGRGIVRTLDDFGYQGEAPSHPELLDWLAAEFVAPSDPKDGQPWSIKRLHRLIVTSATYQQSSKVTPELLAKDPENKLLARAPRVRLEAEQIRDSALKAAGLLSTKMYGPGVFPPQPANVTTEGTYGRLEWNVSNGEDRYRRGLYTFAKRTAPYAMGSTFDAPSGEACLARREVTNNALQALTMLNDTVLLDAAQALGRRVVAHAGKTEERVAYLFRLCLGRAPRAEEATKLAAFYEAQRARFAIDPDRADAVAGIGEGIAAERAAWTATARVILNLDEFITKE